jgi:4-amino-4-deoxy-L-arabinose transferase-like glycosyltransferase
MTAPADPTRLLPAGRKICFVGLPLLLITALSLRIYGIKTIGLGGSDTILYFSLAEQWLQGNFVFRIGESTSVLRPVLLGFNALALQVFGHFDHAIKLANVLLDVVNLLLLALLAWLVSRRYTVVLACAASYAILPLAIWASRQELPHTLSTSIAGCVAAVRCACRQLRRAFLPPPVGCNRRQPFSLNDIMCCPWPGLFGMVSAAQ